MIALPARPRILVVALRRLGDVLLTTPLIRSLKRAWPDATIDVLVFRGTEGILAGNPDIGAVLTLPERASAARKSRALAQALAGLRSRDLHPERRPADAVRLGGGPAAASGFVEAQGTMARVEVAGSRLSGCCRRRTAPRERRAASRRGHWRLAATRGYRAARPAAFRHRAGSPLCGDPCGADVPLQALDRRRLASPRGWSRRARAHGHRDRRSR